MIDGVQLKQLTTHTDERGFFREVLRATDSIMLDGFAQLSQAKMDNDVIKAWHIHRFQTDLWLVPLGKIKAVLCDMRHTSWPVLPNELIEQCEFVEYLMGDDCQPFVLRIPPGVAHGLKVLQGPAYLFYITSQVYNPEDEGRIPYDALGYDWFKQDIK